MAKGKGLAEQVARAAQSGSPGLVPTASTDRPAKQSSRAGKKGLTVYLDRETHRELKHLAVDRDCSIEAVIQKAIADELASHRARRAMP